MIKAAQEAGVGTFLGILIWGALMQLAAYFNLKWAFWILIVALAIGVVWAMLYWPWPRTTRTTQKEE
ncbi:MAG: hypothetical protein AAB487_01155 [Patescibacteria group bacterium]